MKYIKTIFVSGINIIKQISWPTKIFLVMVVLSVLIAGSIIVTGQPSFCNSCHIMNPYYKSWLLSGHSEVNCLDCHLQPGFTGYIKGKVNGLAQAIDCMVGRVGTKPNATVKDVSCLRSECHNIKELIADNIDYEGTKFSHKNHIQEVVGGMLISCGTCHSHFEGDEHFTINNNVCFTCHFLKDKRSEIRLVQTTCQSCHEVPNKVIERGLVSINHAEFVSYKANCEDSCHKKEIQKASEVADNICLNCHSFNKGQWIDSVQLHEMHTNQEKVECFACHGKMSHGQTEVASISAMMDCQNCHSETHQVQRSIYTTQHPMQEEKSAIALSPMFLTHVECSGCHIERVRKSSGTLDSFGVVAEAVPRACDLCHEEGTGQQYIPFWQGKTKALYESVKRKLTVLEQRSQYETNKQQLQKLNESIRQANSILESVVFDGSWGVHNFKYTEAMLLKADKIITQTR